MFQTIKLAKLRLSPINVRTVEDKALAIEPLAADITARGVLQNLLITPVTKPRGMFEVFDGGRRLRALMLMAERGAIDADTYDVPVMVLKADTNALSETSLAANFHQLKLTPAEECRAFLHFLGKDGDIDAVASRFGQTRRFIEGRLRLASLAEPIFDALAKGEITLDHAKAYGCTENHDKQMRVFEQVSRYGGYNADYIRRMIVQDSMRSDDPIAILVGEDAYVGADGRIERDLFSAQNEDRWLDPEIAEQLAATRLEEEAARIAADLGVAWIRPIATENTWEASSKLHRVTVPPRPFTQEEQVRVEELEARCSVIEIEMEDEAISDEAYAAFEAEYDTLGEERQALHDRPRILPDELKPHVGQFLKLSRKGEMVLDCDYYSETLIQFNDAGEVGDGGNAITIGGHGGGQRGGGDTKPQRPEAVAPGGNAISARLFDELAVQRRDILAASLLGHPGLALDYMLFAMTDAKRGYGQYGTTIKAPGPQDPQIGDIGAGKARAYLAQAHEGLDASWMDGATDVERFEAFRLLDDDAKAGWLAYTVAVSLEAKPTYDARQNPMQNRIASVLEIDVAAWWRPTAANFFDRVSKGSLLALLDDVGGPALSGRYASSKKGEISTSCEKLFAGEAIVEDGVKDKALAWVPNAMLFLDGASEAPGNFEGGDDGSNETAIDEDEGDQVGDAVVDDATDVGADSEALVDG
ncbi:MAG: ParB/RepB/Spo0J family partition protein [Sphingomonadaceae bacterium]|nr:ParB/RepB/Spo0J family partition protein [Sphingomonadaceae bacterium]